MAVYGYDFEPGRGVSPDDRRTRLKKVFKEKNTEKIHAHKGDSALKERPEQLKEAFAVGLIDEEIFNAKKQDILSEF